MRWLTIAVALSAFLLVVAGCGGDDEAASDTTTLTETTLDDTTLDTTTDQTTTDDTTTDDDSEGLASGECAELVEAGTQLGQARPGRDAGSGRCGKAAAGARLDRPAGSRSGVPADQRVDDRELLSG